ncbi:MAG: ATP-dependent DNA helicase RecG [Treponema sp.]|nr:ATP-dependent DNA helicase RecG [Treponema sp.]
MFLRSLLTKINKNKYIDEDIIKKLSRLGIFTITDLFLHYPRAWEDRSKIIPLSEFQKSPFCCVPVKVITREYMGYGNTRAMKAYIEDENGSQAVLLCFNLKKRPWLEKQLTIDSKHMVYGEFKIGNYGELQCSSFDIASISSKKFGKILPVYPLTSGLKQEALRRITANVLEQYSNKIENELPDKIIEKYNLLSKSKALNEIHYPSSMEELERAKKTIIYEELFYLEVMVGKRAIERRMQKTRVKAAESREQGAGSSLTTLQNMLLQRLPFELTKGQLDAASEINGDMNNPVPMARLLQGDVGCGKTLVSFLAALFAVEKNGQAVIMAPTELLARQHAENAARLLEPLGIRIAFLTGNIKAKGRKELLKNLLSGKIDIVVGTHALFSNDVEYKNLTFVVIDEQHRFGVTQRALIIKKGTAIDDVSPNAKSSPDLLMMSATPIPRTLALTVFGDMDVSVIKDMPPGRKPIITHLAKESNEKKVYDFIDKELAQGKQAYFVYPLIEEGDELKDAVSMSERLSKEIFPKYKTALIHSKIDEEEKKQIMDDFRKGKIQILAATSVVEVGVDVPNATCMVIEHAERFGLSALHQLRGRVGRGKDQSYCFLVYSDVLSEDGKTRLKVMLENTDGFVIAEEDLKLRGPGLFAGTEQSGYMTLGLANPIRDIEELNKAREDVFSILENDPDLLLGDNRIIARVLEEAPPFSEVAL